MAKKLPFFKFDALEWIKGNVQILEPVEKGIFVELLARIWAENGELKNDNFLHRKLSIKKVELSNALQCFFELGIMQEKDGYLSVKFLKAQLLEHADYIEKRRLAGSKGGRPKKVEKPKKKEERRKKKEDNIKKINKKNENDYYDLVITNTLETLNIPEKIKKLFIEWVKVRVMCHGKLPAQSQDGQIKRLLEIPEELREKSLKAAITGTWKNIGKIQEQDKPDDETAAFRTTGRE